MDKNQWNNPNMFVPRDNSGEKRKSVSNQISDFRETDSLVGRIICNKYRVAELLGQGGMALVYKATTHDGTTVAVKTLKYIQSDLETRFGQEIAIHSKLKHKNIVDPIEIVRDPDTGLNCFIMEYLEGLNLEDLLAKYKRLNSVEDITIVLAQILDALEYAHFHGIIHRDLKPENIIVVSKNGKNQIKILDFGLAKIEEDLQKITKTGVVLGSPTYMSPEQCIGSEIDSRTDLYSFGVLAYEIITGYPPYQSDDPMELMKLHCDSFSKPPSMMGYRDDLAAIEKLDAILQKVLNTDVNSRHSDIYDLKEDMTQWWIQATNRRSKKKTPFRFITDKNSALKQTQPTIDSQSSTALDALVQNKINTEKKSFTEKTERDSKNRFANKQTPVIKITILCVFVLSLLSIGVFVLGSLFNQNNSQKGKTHEIKDNSIEDSNKKNQLETTDDSSAKPKAKSNKRIVSPSGVYKSR